MVAKTTLKHTRKGAKNTLNHFFAKPCFWTTLPRIWRILKPWACWKQQRKQRKTRPQKKTAKATSVLRKVSQTCGKGHPRASHWVWQKLVFDPDGEPMLTNFDTRHAKGRQRWLNHEIYTQIVVSKATKWRRWGTLRASLAPYSAVTMHHLQIFHMGGAFL